MTCRSNSLRAAVLATGLLVPAAAHAGPYTAEYVFGDSYSDHGNQPELLGQARPNPPSYQQNSGNGPTAAQVVAQDFGLSYQPSLWATNFQDPLGLFGGASFTPGTVYAVAGSTAGGNVPGVPAALANTDLNKQVAAFVGHVGAGNADPGALYYVFSGGNDIRSAALLNQPGLVASGVAAEIATIQTLISNGARDFLVPNLQDIGTLPEIAQDNASVAPAATSYSQQWNALLTSQLTALEAANPEASITAFDFYDFNDQLRANAAQYGLTDITDRCYTATPYSAATSPQCGPGAQNIAQLYWWDWRHPTAQVDQLWGDAMAASLPVPEPASGALLAGGLAALAAARSRRMRS